MANLLHVIVRDRSGVQWEGEAAAVSGFNEAGPFDVLPSHANFISIIKKKLVTTKPDGAKQEINVESGVMHVQENKVMVYLGVK